MGGDSLEDFKRKLNIPDMINVMKDMPQVECPVKHYFSKDLYTRETTMPKGTFAIGKKHRYETINIILKGKLSIYNGEDSPILQVEAPYIFISKAGVQKMAYFHEETIWVNCHATDLKDLDLIEKEFIISPADDIIECKEAKSLEE